MTDRERAAALLDHINCSIRPVDVRTLCELLKKNNPTEGGGDGSFSLEQLRVASDALARLADAHIHIFDAIEELGGLPK
jgi:hypothetical protein